jgi:hypothetical protein
MKRRITGGLTAVFVILGLCLAPAWSQVFRFRFAPATFQPGAGGYHTVTWEDLAPDEVVGDPGVISSLTWYYATRPDGADRKRMTTLFHDDFAGGFRANWRMIGRFAHNWIVRQERPPRGQFYLAGPGDACPAVSAVALPRNTVLSVLVRPRDLQTGFTLSLRVQENGQCYTLRTAADTVSLLEGEQPVAEQGLQALEPDRWYWYEVGMLTRRAEVIIRARVMDHSRTHVLADMPCVLRPQDPRLRDEGRIALWGAADFAEIYVDPWTARWVDDHRNEFQWDTSMLPDGDYFLVAEVIDGKNPPRRITSEIPVRIRRLRRLGANE